MEIKPLTAQIDVVIDNEPLNAKIIELQSQIKELESEKSELQAQLQTMQGKNTELENRIKSLAVRILELQTELQNLQDDLDNLNGEIVTDKSKYALDTKNLIAGAINDKGGEITPSTTFRNYAGKIEALPVKKTGDKNTLLLMHFDKSTTKDSSIYENKLHEYGAPILSGDQSKFGARSLYLDGESCLYFDSADFQPFGINYTFEFWFYPMRDFETSRMCIFSYDAKPANAYNAEYWHYTEFNSNRLYWQYFARTSDYTAITYDTIGIVRAGTNYGLKYNQWNHIAFVRNQTEVSYITKLYINGEFVSWNSVPNNPKYCSLDTFVNLPVPLYLFAFHWENASTGRFLKGYVNELRVSNIARYTENFTPSTEPFGV